MAFSCNLITLSILLTMAACVIAKLGIGLDPEMTVDKMKALWLDTEELERAKACFKKIGPCTPLLKNVTELLPEVYKTACAACNERERQVYRLGSRNTFLRDLPCFSAVLDRIDPDHIYLDSFKNFIWDMYN